MKISIEERDGRKIELTTDAVDIYAVLGEIRNLLDGFGFHHCSVKEAFLQIAEEIKEESCCKEKED